MHELNLRDADTSSTRKANSLMSRPSFRHTRSFSEIHKLKNELGSSKTNLNKS